MFQIQVALNMNGDPEVVVSPLDPTVRRHEDIIWTQIGTQSFTFVSLTPIKNTLHDIKYNSNHTQITATYDAKAKDQCDYTIVVQDSQGGLHDTIFRGIGNGGAPTIKNN